VTKAVGQGRVTEGRVSGWRGERGALRRVAHRLTRSIHERVLRVLGAPHPDPLPFRG